VSCKDVISNFDKDKYNMEKFTWKEDYKVVMTKKQKYEENEANAWALIYNQCSPALKNKLEGAHGYKISKKDNNVVALLVVINLMPI
jgi:hypothetical protein